MTDSPQSPQTAASSGPDAGRRVLVAGYGSPLRGDDAAGRRVAEAIAARWGDRVHVLVDHHPMPEWVVALAAADVVYLVDAAPGASAVTVRRIEERPPGSPPLLDGHALGPEALLGLSRLLDGRAPEAYLVCIPASDFAFSEELSARTAAAVDEAVALLDALLAARLGPAPSAERAWG
jgi:hydrogenase maturation protease